MVYVAVFESPDMFVKLSGVSEVCISLRLFSSWPLCFWLLFSLFTKNGKVCPNCNWASQEDSSVPTLNSGFCSMKRLRVFLLPLDGIMSIAAFCQVVSNLVEKGTVRVKYFA